MLESIKTRTERESREKERRKNMEEERNKGIYEERRNGNGVGVKRGEKGEDGQRKGKENELHSRGREGKER